MTVFDAIGTWNELLYHTQKNTQPCSSLQRVHTSGSLTMYPTDMWSSSHCVGHRCRLLRETHNAGSSERPLVRGVIATLCFVLFHFIVYVQTGLLSYRHNRNGGHRQILGYSGPPIIQRELWTFPRLLPPLVRHGTNLSPNPP